MSPWRSASSSGPTRTSLSTSTRRQPPADTWRGGAVVGVLGDKTFATYVAALTASRAGASAAFVSPSMPATRARAVLQLLRPAAVSGPSGWLDGLEVAGVPEGRAESADAYWRTVPSAPAPSGSLLQQLRADPGYVVFTSGSTGVPKGVPKGVPITGSAIRSYLGAITPQLRITSESRMSHTFDLSFDAAMHDLLMTWRAGARRSACPRTRAPARLRLRD